MAESEIASTLLNELVASTEEEHSAYAGMIPEMVAAEPEKFRMVIEFLLSQANVDQSFLAEAVPVLEALGTQDGYRYKAVALLGALADKAIGESAESAEIAIKKILR